VKPEDDESLIATVSAAYSSVLYADPPAPDADLLEAAALDSYALLQLLVELDERLGLHVEPQDISTEDVRTIRRLAAFVARQRAAGGSGA
jgi:acyl carrier protein